METTVRKHIQHVVENMVVRQLGGGGVMLFFSLFVVIFSISCIIIAALKTDA